MVSPTITTRARSVRRPRLLDLFWLGLAVAFIAVPSALLVQASPGGPVDNVVLDFTATWCGPCQQMSPIVSRLERQGYAIRKVDIDQEKQLARKFGISSIPCFVLVVNGKEVNRITGAASEEQLRRLVAQIPQGGAGNIAQNQLLETPGARPLPNRPADGGAYPEVPAIEIGSTNSEPKPPKAGGWNLLSRSKPKKEPVANNSLFDDARAQSDRGPDNTTPSLDPMAASVRIRVTDSTGVNFGSGTLVESKIGRSVIVTCGHIFRKLSKDSRIEVDLFATPNKPETFLGTAIGVDLEADVGLIEVPTTGVYATVKIAPVKTQLQPSQSVFSIGCGGGDLPSLEELQVTALNRYLGPDNVECSGVPVQGRSGGGLFSKNNELVGVCIAADPKEQRGLYAGLAPIAKLLAEKSMAHLAPGSAKQNANNGNPIAATPDNLDSIVGDGLIEGLSGGSAGADDLKNALGESPDAEIICIVRPKAGTPGKSRIVIINRASKKFQAYLLDEVAIQDARQPVSLRIDRSSSQDLPADSELTPFGK